MSDLATLSALAEIRKHQIIQAKFNEQTKDIYSDAYAYAICKFVHPIFQEDILDNCYNEQDKTIYFPFHKIYKITYEQVTEVRLHLIKEFTDGSNIKFRDLERYYQTAWNVVETEDDLIKICRYLCLHEEFNKDFWKSLILNHNDRVLQINKEFRLSEISNF